VFEAVYLKSPSTPNPKGITPKTRFRIPEGELTLPEFYDTVKTLAQVVKVDYYLPGCPPPVKLILEALEAIFEGRLPPLGSVLAPDKALCDECERNTERQKELTDICRVHELIADPKSCFLDQGIICMGPATRSGCGASCIKANMPCTGCMGPLSGVLDQGAKFLSGLGSIIKVADEKNVRLEELKKLLGKVKDPIGTFYMYGLANSILRRRR
jgi:F420-non-reducing hydrogenase small subunit